MSQIKINNKGPLHGEITPPSDKSISHRAVMFASLAEGTSTISNFLQAEDPLRTLEAFRQLGTHIETIDNNRITVQGKGLYGLSAPDHVLDCGNSGTTMRLMSGVLAAQSFSSERPTPVPAMAEVPS